MSDYNELVGNLSTVVKLLLISVFPSITTYIASDLLYTAIVFIVCLAIGIIDAKYPNTLKMFNSNKKQVSYSDTVEQ
jgi:hypothetical protein